MGEDCCVLAVITPGSDAELREGHPTKSLIKAGRSGQRTATLQREHSLLLLQRFYPASATVQRVWERPAESRGNSEKSNIIH